MKFTLTLLMLICCAVLANAQESCVEVRRLEVDGKVVNDDFRVLIYAGAGRILEPEVVGNKFIVPPELGSDDWVDVRFIFGKHDLFFRTIHTSKFKADWIVGLDTDPFDKKNLPPLEPNKKLIAIYYIEFIPKKGPETRVQVEIYQ